MVAFLMLFILAFFLVMAFAAGVFLNPIKNPLVESTISTYLKQL